MIKASWRELAWDTAHFGARVARLEGPLEDRSEGIRVLRECQEAGIRCLTYLVEVGDGTSAAVAQGLGFSAFDSRVELEWRPEWAVPSPARSVEVVLARPEDLPRVEELAAETAAWSRFDRDGGFQRGRAADMYRCWVRQAAEDERGAVLVTRDPMGEVEGMLTIVRLQSEEARITLVAVSRQAQGRAVGSSLVRAAQARTVAWDRKKLFVATQGANAPARRLYDRMGFRAISESLWLHRWF